MKRAAVGLLILVSVTLVAQQIPERLKRLKTVQVYGGVYRAGWGEVVVTNYGSHNHQTYYTYHELVDGKWIWITRPGRVIPYSGVLSATVRNYPDWNKLKPGDKFNSHIQCYVLAEDQRGNTVVEYFNPHKQ